LRPTLRPCHEVPDWFAGGVDRLLGEDEERHLAAVWTGHVVAPLVTREEQSLDAAHALEQRRAAVDDLPIPERLRASNAEPNRIAFGARTERIRVRFIERHHTTRHATEPAAAIRADHRDDAAGKTLMQDRVVAVARFGFGHQRREHGAIAQHRRDLLLAVALRVVERRLHDGNRTGILVNKRTDRGAEHFGVPDARRFHERDVLDVRVRHRVERLALVRTRPPAARVSSGLWRQVEELVRPLGTAPAPRRPTQPHHARPDGVEVREPVGVELRHAAAPLTCSALSASPSSAWTRRSFRCASCVCVRSGSSVLYLLGTLSTAVRICVTMSDQAASTARAGTSSPALARYSSSARSARAFFSRVDAAAREFACAPRRVTDAPVTVGAVT